MDGWTMLQINGVDWYVANVYTAPMSLRAAACHAAEMGCELPTSGMVDAIWLAAGLRLPPLPRRHNGTIQQMATAAVYSDQAARIAAQLDCVDTGTTLIAGTHKDVIKAGHGQPGLYGWHQLSGVAIQPPYFGHSLDWIDYSQGLRLCRRA